LTSPRRLLAPLALTQFICGFAGSNMNVTINDISEDLDTTVTGVQATITLFLLTMAILMIPCSKLSDRWGRKRCFVAGLALYGVGALLSAIAPGLGVLILGNSVLEGVGTALLIPPVYIITTLAFSDLTSRARAFGVISGMGGNGAAAGPSPPVTRPTSSRWSRSASSPSSVSRPRFAYPPTPLSRLPGTHRRAEQCRGSSSGTSGRPRCPVSCTARSSGSRCSSLWRPNHRARAWLWDRCWVPQSPSGSPSCTARSSGPRSAPGGAWSGRTFV
jgi:Major Facilitator Superfamily